MISTVIKGFFMFFAQVYIFSMFSQNQSGSMFKLYVIRLIITTKYRYNARPLFIREITYLNSQDLFFANIYSIEIYVPTFSANWHPFKNTFIANPYKKFLYRLQQKQLIRILYFLLSMKALSTNDFYLISLWMDDSWGNYHP